MAKSKSPKVKLSPAEVSAVSGELQALNRHRTIVIKSRIMNMNRLVAITAGTIGYSSGLDEKARQEKFREAEEFIKKVEAGESDGKNPIEAMIKVTMIGINEFRKMQESLEAEMKKLVMKLPVIEWVESPQQKGFGALSLAVVVGECGDLANYPNPAKVWRRMGLAPWTYEGKTAMGSTWKSGQEGKLPSEEWERFGYSPRRRAVSYVFATSLLRQGSAYYRAVYDTNKASFKERHPDYSDKRIHLHGMLMQTKVLLMHLWQAWNPEMNEAWLQGRRDKTMSRCESSVA